MNRRLLPLLLAATIAGAACSADGDAAAPVDGPASADRLTIALPEARGPLNLFAGSDEAVAELVYDKLLAPSPYVEEPRPWLATEVRFVDPTTWEADLRDDVVWHDGEPFTAEDVVFSIAYFAQAPTGRWTHHVSDVPTFDASLVDSDTVRFTCAFACPELGTVTLADLPIVPEHVWAQVPPEDAKEVRDLPVGTGPYRLVDFDPVTGYRFEANTGYFAGEPTVRELVMPVIEDPSATFTALRSGQIDAALAPVSPELIAEFSAPGSPVQLVRTAPFQFPELRLNFRNAPFDDPDFRRAISRAVDRAEMLDTVFLGQGRPADKGYPHPDAPFANPELSTPYDPDEARAILDGLGLVDIDGDGVREGPGGPLRYEILANGGQPIDMRAAELVAEDLSAVGVAATAVPLDAGTLAERSTERDFDLVIGTITAHGVADPTQFIMSHRSGYLWEHPEIPYPEFDALFRQWQASTTIEDRLAALDDIQAMFNDQPTSVPLYYPDEYYAFRPDRYAGWAESPGFGIVHKWSLLPADVVRGANAVVAGD
ncbi:MAG TPA: peptide ABC transporter substrate-binding protein [Pseudonocardia sp.]|nr:peptide ABC transporter substrate-binding protein [Pseudonocardia sp.]